jgi:sulfur carrier protein ThiS
MKKLNPKSDTVNPDVIPDTCCGKYEEEQPLKSTEDKRLEELLKIVELNKTGYAGILSNGNIVDRREHPEAIPIQENKMFGVIKPKDL